MVCSCHYLAIGADCLRVFVMAIADTVIAKTDQSLIDDCCAVCLFACRFAV